MGGVRQTARRRRSEPVMMKRLSRLRYLSLCPSDEWWLARWQWWMTSLPDYSILSPLRNRLAGGERWLEEFVVEIRRSLHALFLHRKIPSRAIHNAENSKRRTGVVEFSSLLRRGRRTHLRTIAGAIKQVYKIIAIVWKISDGDGRRMEPLCSRKIDLYAPVYDSAFSHEAKVF